MEFMMQNIEGKGKFIADKFKLSQDELSKDELPLNCHRLKPVELKKWALAQIENKI